MIHYIIIAIVLVLIELIYFKIADKYNIVDKPNERSSHSYLTIRGGGIIFPLAVMIAYLMGYSSFLLTLAVLIVAVVSFIDDIRPLHQLPRFSAHALAALVVAFDLNLLQGSLWLLPVALVGLIGWINAFNFMDGINGITVLYALSTIIGFSFVTVHDSNLPLLITVAISCLIFGFFNIRKIAKTFAGDIGSISLALFLGFFMIKTIASTGQIGYLLFFAVYGVDAISTILKRISKKENIFKPHRSHLYQYLVNEFGYSHFFVASMYALIQLIINSIVLIMDAHKILNLSTSTLLFFIIASIYILVRAKFELLLSLKKN